MLFTVKFRSDSFDKSKLISLDGTVNQYGVQYRDG